MDLQLRPIGIYQSERKEAYSLPRQPDHNSESPFSNEPGLIQLNEGFNFQQALIGLEGFSHLWVIYAFHRNHHWKPMTLPPRGSPQKIGVFGTRSPYRPNPLGLSCVRIKKIEGLKIFVEGADLMDQSPILDIKPYITYSDSLPNAKQGWLENIEKNQFQLQWNENFNQKLNWLKKEASAFDSPQQNSILQLQDFASRQLEYDPCDERRKRVHLQGDYYILSYRTWRIQFQVDQALQKIQIENLYSGYSSQDLSEAQDPHGDKNLHRLFQEKFK